MAVTAAEIRDRAAQALGLLRLGQSLDHQDSTRITQGYAEVYAKLKKEGLAVWAYTGGSMPDEIASEVAYLIADNCKDDYGLSDSRYIRITSKASTALRDIRKYIKPDYISQTDARDY